MNSSSTDDGQDHLFKLIVIGDAGVGKSSLLTRFTRGKFKVDSKPTTTNNTFSRHVYIDGKVVKVQIVDIPGNHRYRTFSTDVQVQSAEGALIVYDVTRHSTFENVEKWYRELRLANSELEVMLIVNKSDLAKDSSTTNFTEDGKAFAERESISFIETSAKDDRNVEKAFAELVTRMFKMVNTNVTMDVVDAHARPLIMSEARVLSSSGKNEPSHYMLKIECFSLLAEVRTRIIESDVFEASGYKWKLELYPNGNMEENVGDHISIYLAICGTQSFLKGWEVYVDAKFYVYDHIRESYMIFQDDDGMRTRFNEKKIKWGFSKLITLESFKDPNIGFLFHDSCEFGAEVFVVSKYAAKDECLSMIKPPAVVNTHTWTIENFPAITDENVLYSSCFKVGKVKWKLVLYPKGWGTGKGTNLSIFLKVHDYGLLPEGGRVYSRCKLRVKNQCGFFDREIEFERWFEHKSAHGFGTPEFMFLTELNDQKNGFLLHDVLTVEAEILAVGLLQTFN